jgi:hypothetical protein
MADCKHSAKQNFIEDGLKMGFSNRSIRVRIAAAALAFVGVFTNSLVAQQPAAPQPAAPQFTAAQSEATDPVLVLTVGSVDKLFPDFDYLFSVIGQPQLSMLTGIARTFTQGVDTTQPLAVVVPLVNGVPQPIALLPTQDVKSVLERLEAQVGPADELDDGTLVVAVGASTVFIRQMGNWGVFAAKKELLDLAPSDPMSLFGDMGNKDLAFRLNMQRVPASTRGILTAQVRQGFEQAMARREGDTETTREVAESTIAQLEQLINETDELKFGINIDPSAHQIVLDGSFTAVPGSTLASIYGGQRSTPSQFSSVIRDDAAAFFHSAMSISPEAVDMMRKNVTLSLRAIRTALADEDSLSPTQQAEISAFIDRIADLAVNSISEGRANVGGLLLADENEFRFVFGSFVSDGNEAAEVLKELAKNVSEEPGAPRFKFDQSTYKDVSMHLIDADVPEGDEARLVFGETIRVHVGTGPKSVYLAVGENSQELMKELIDKSTTDSSANRPVGQVRITLLPVLEFAQSVKQNDTLSAMIDALSRSPDPGELTFVQESIPNGQKTKVTIAEGLIKAIAAAVRQVQQAELQEAEF